MTLCGLPLQAQTGLREISPPGAPMLFRRRLMREMAGGHAIIAERGFEVRFLAQGGGYRVEGAQISSTIEAPPVLARIAELERARIETGLFPLMLGVDGMIRAGPEAQPLAELDEAVDLALAQIRQAIPEAPEQREASAFILRLQQAAGSIGTQMPRDLFVPPADAAPLIRAIDLPGGDSGQIEINFRGRISAASGLMVEAERIITTTVGETRRSTVENWSLALRD